MRWCQLYLFMSIISIFSKTRNVYFVNVLSFNVRDFDFSYRAFWPGFCDKWNKPFLLFDMFFFIYIYTVLFFLMNELSYWLSFPFRFILLLRRTMFVELGFHRRLGISQFLDCPRVSDEWKNRRYSRLPRMGSDISVNSGAFLFFWRLPDFRDGQRTLQLKLYAKALAYYQSSFFLAELFPQRCTVVRLSGSCVFWSWASTLQEFPFYCPFRCCYVEVLWELPLWPCECTSKDHDQ